jgi:hypothetical protein
MRLNRARRRAPAPLQAVLVNMRTGTAIRGALAARRPNALVLRSAAVAEEHEGGRVSWTKLDGEIVIPIENVDYYQSALDASLLND